MVAPRPKSSSPQRFARLALLIATAGIVAIVGSLTWFGRRVMESEAQVRANLQKAQEAQGRAQIADAAATAAEVRKRTLEASIVTLQAQAAHLRSSVALLTKATDQARLKSAAEANPTLARKVPIVYIQVAQEDAAGLAEATRVQAVLNAGGLLAPGVERVARTPDATELRMNRRDFGSPTAQRVLDVLKGAGIAARPKAMAPPFEGKPNQFELWFARTAG